MTNSLDRELVRSTADRKTWKAAEEVAAAIYQTRGITFDPAEIIDQRLINQPILPFRLLSWNPSNWYIGGGLKMLVAAAAFLAFTNRSDSPAHILPSSTSTQNSKNTYLVGSSPTLTAEQIRALITSVPKEVDSTSTPEALWPMSVELRQAFQQQEVNAWRQSQLAEGSTISLVEYTREWVGTVSPKANLRSGLGALVLPDSEAQLTSFVNNHSVGDEIHCKNQLIIHHKNGSIETWCVSPLAIPFFNTPSAYKPYGFRLLSRDNTDFVAARSSSAFQRLAWP